MKIKLFSLRSLLIPLALLSLWPLATAAQSVPPPPNLDVKSWILLDAQTGQVLTGSDYDERVEPASITKVMTTYVIYDEIAQDRMHLDDDVLISEKAWRQGIDSSESRMFLDVGSHVKVEDLLRGIVIQSGNDASIAMAEHVAGTEEAFASLMNQHAKQLDMKNSHFVNSTGLPDPEHYTSAHDIALLVRALIKNFPDDYAMYSQKEFTYNGIKQRNRNGLLWRDSTIDGVKTGHTSKAGYCLATSAVRDGRRLIGVVMGAGSWNGREQSSLAILNYGFRFFDTVKLYEAGSPIQTLRIFKGSTEELPVGTIDTLAVSIPRGAQDKLSVQADVQQPLIAPVQAGQTLGTVTVSLDGDTLLQEPLVALQEVPEGGLWDKLVDEVRLRFFE